MILASPSHTTTAGAFILYYVVPLLGGLTLLLISFAVWIVKRIQEHSTGLALILQDVRPANGPSLRDLLQQLNADVAVIKSQPSNHGNP